jgi:hypothetical protein
MAYFYKRTGRIPDSPVLPNQQNVTLTWTEKSDEDSIVVKHKQELFCDNLFWNPIEMLKSYKNLKEFVQTTVDNHLNSGRGKRTRSKPQEK